jgi:hypothetical protein
MFSPEQIRALKIFNQSITMRPIPIDQQEAVRNGKDIWCADWWTIEVLKCLFNCEEMYRLDPPPNRLKHNKIWSMEQIITAKDAKLGMLKLLEENKDFSDTLWVCEVGRGIDILLASFVKPWKKIVCYDNNEYILEEVNLYFKEQLGLPVETFRINSGNFDFNTVTEKVVMVANITRLGEPQKELIKNKDNILEIFDGRRL